MTSGFFLQTLDGAPAVLLTVDPKIVTLIIFTFLLVQMMHFVTSEVLQGIRKKCTMYIFEVM